MGGLDTDTHCKDELIRGFYYFPRVTNALWWSMGNSEHQCIFILKREIA